MAQEPFFLGKPYDDIVCVAQGRNGRICVLDKEWHVALEIINQDPRESRIQRNYFGRWCNGEYLSQDNFGPEGSYGSGKGDDYKIYAFKGYQLRMYGSIVKIDNIKTLIVAKCVKKKQDKMKKNDGVVTATRISQILMR